MKTRFTLKALALAFTAALFFNASSAQAQLNSTGTVTLTLDLRNVLEFSVLEANSSVIFNTVAEYNLGTDTTQAAQLKVSSNIPYKIEVKSSSTAFDDGSSHTIPLSVMHIKMNGNSDNDVTFTQPEVTLATTNGTIATTTTGSIDRTYSVRYRATPSATGSVPGNEFITSPTGVYSATLVYTVTQL